MGCSGQYFELWSNGQIVSQGPAGQSAPVPLPDRAAQFSHLHCQIATAYLNGGETLEPGIYAIASPGAITLQNGGWQPMPDNQATLLRRFATDNIIYDSPRLRLQVGPLATSYQHFWRDNRWRALPWLNGLPALDHTLGLARDMTGWLRITPLGLISYNDVTPNLAVDPAALRLRTGDQPETLGNCSIERVETADGRDHASPSLQGAPVQLRCADGTLWHTSADTGQDLGAVQPLAADPFLDRTLFDEADFMRWVQTGAAAASAARAQISLHGELISLDAGRFSVDDYRSISALRPGQLDIIAANGWWAYPAATPSLTQASRPDDIDRPETARAFSDMRDETGQLSLCATLGEQSLLIAAGQAPRSADLCWDDQGRDAIWAYQTTPTAAPVARATALNGPQVTRRLQAGRFTDMTAISPPVYAGTAAQLDAVYALPSQAGLMLLNADGARLGLLAFESSPLAISTPDLAAIALLSATPLPPSPGVQLPNCPSFEAAIAALPSDHHLRRAGYESANVMQLYISSETAGRTWLRLACDTVDNDASQNLLHLPATQRLRYMASLAVQPNASGAIEIEQRDDQLLLTDGRGRVLDLGSTGPAAALAILSRAGQPTALIVTESELFLLDIDAAITALADQPLQPVEPTIEMQTPIEPTTDTQPLEEPLADMQTPDEPIPAELTPEQIDQLADELSAKIAEQLAANAANTAAANTTAEAAPAAPINPAQSDIVALANLTVEQILAVQTALKASVAPRLNVDGIIGAQTAAAILSYQYATGAARTGQFTHDQYESLTGERLP